MRNLKSIQAQRNKLTRKAYSQGLRVFNSIRKDLKSGFAVNASIYDFEVIKLNKAEVEKKVRQLIVDIYILGGTSFAEATVKDILSKGRKGADLPLQKKSDLWGEWRRMMEAFVDKRCGLKIQSITRTLFDDIERITKKVVAEAARE
jgi:glutamate mutase epsilon subunit